MADVSPFFDAGFDGVLVWEIVKRFEKKILHSGDSPFSQ
jgi:hypothetical protein